MVFMKLLCQQKSLVKSLRTLQLVSAHRTYLSASYRCEEAWNERLENPLIKKAKPDQFYYDLVQKSGKDRRVSAIDADLFINCLTKDTASKNLGEMEEIMRLIRRSPEACKVFKSTTHAVIRNLAEVDNTDTILRFINDPFNYGCFLCDYLANFLMDKYLEEQNYLVAARVAAHLMIQEDFDNPLTRSFMLLSAYRYVNCDKNEPWVDYTFVPEPEEEVKIRVDYLHNPYFDDHFDIKDPEHLVGKTLAWTFSFSDGIIQQNCQVLGWSLYEKWDKLEETLNAIPHGSLLPEIVSKCLIAVEKCEDKKELFIELLEKCKSDSEKSFDSILEEKLLEDIKNYEDAEIKKQCEVYRKWDDYRTRQYKLAVILFRKLALEKEIQTKESTMKDQEDLIYFFDKKDQWEVRAEEKRRLRKYYEVSKVVMQKEQEEQYDPDLGTQKRRG